MSLIESQGIEPSGLSENQALSFVGGVLPIEISKKSPNRVIVLTPGIKAYKSLTWLKERLIILSLFSIKSSMVPIVSTIGAVQEGANKQSW